MNNFEKLTQNIPNLLTSRHAQIIYGLVRWLKPEKILEIGAYQGYLSCYLAQGLIDNGLAKETALYIMDNFSLPGTDPSNISNALTFCGVNEVPHFIINGNSQTLPMEAWPMCQMAIVDGDHSLNGCKNDVEHCMQMGAECIVIHDTVDWWGPRDFINLIKDNPDYPYNFIECGFDSGLAILLLKVDKSAPPQYTNGADILEVK